MKIIRPFPLSPPCFLQDAALFAQLVAFDSLFVFLICILSQFFYLYFICILSQYICILFAFCLNFVFVQWLKVIPRFPPLPLCFLLDAAADADADQLEAVRGGLPLPSACADLS